MFARVLSFAPFGVDALPVEVEVDVSPGLPTFEVVGLPDSAVREARERVRAALRNSGCTVPPRRITVNLAPADLRKEGAGFDLAIALGVLVATEQLAARPLEGLAVVGQLALDGRLRPVPGVLAMALAAREQRLRGLLLPAAAAAEGALAGLPVYPADTLADVLAWLRGSGTLPPVATAGASAANGGGSLPATPGSDSQPAPADLAEVRGQALARRALEIAAAGGHSLLLHGPPGAGKSLLARCLPGILPPLEPDESLEVTRIHSVAGLHPTGLLTARPFRAPHHSASPAALLGGGNPPRPGEVSLAHRGVLFLDELPEFRRDALEGLRQPLEEGCVHLARTGWRLTFPARFQLVAAANPCPCGLAGDPRRPCTCHPGAVQRYRERLSGPLLDRVDMVLRVAPVSYDELAAGTPEPSAAVADRVRRAWQRQRERYAGTGLHGNADLGHRQLAALGPLPAEAERLLRDACERLGLSARGRDRVLRVARTIADLAGEDRIGAPHVAEALQYRGTW